MDDPLKDLLGPDFAKAMEGAGLGNEIPTSDLQAQINVFSTRMVNRTNNLLKMIRQLEERIAALEIPSG